ncbi:MAG: DUF1801 domain-containing protein [Anaerolineae bacterium]|nr:DUF1801 domain-containing protein [Anaerolineae bacterium]
MDKFKTLADFYASLSGDKKAQVEAISHLLHAAVPELQETLKWNAPNFVFEGNDRLTLNLMNKEGKVKLILHMGATKKEDKKARPIMTDSTGLIAWSSDIRGTITFESADHVRQVRQQVTELVQAWLKIPV